MSQPFELVIIIIVVDIIGDLGLKVKKNRQENKCRSQDQKHL